MKPSSRIVKCPVCKGSSRYDDSNPFRPFCSAGCKDQDTVSWADEEYRYAGPAVDPDDLAHLQSQESASSGRDED